MKRFGEKLRVLRQQHQLSQKELGDMLDVSRAYVSRLERNEKMPNVPMLLKLSRIFNILSDQLIKDELELGE